MIGTEDKDYLQQRASNENGLPKRLSSFFDVENYLMDIVFYLDDGMKISFPPIEKDEWIQSHYVVAFVKKEKDISPWFAVDVRPSEILNAAGCK